MSCRGSQRGRVRGPAGAAKFDPQACLNRKRLCGGGRGCVRFPAHPYIGDVSLQGGTHGNPTCPPWPFLREMVYICDSVWCHGHGDGHC